MTMKIKRHHRNPKVGGDERGTVQVIVRLVGPSKTRRSNGYFGYGPVKGNKSWSLQLEDVKVSEVSQEIVKIIKET